MSEGDRRAGDRARVDAAVFAPDGVTWRRISPAWRTVQLIGSAIGWGLLAVVAAVPVQLIWQRWVITGPILAAVLALFGWSAWLVFRRWPWWGYAERAEDLWVRHGLMWRSLTVVPYGRMQVIDVTAGPIERAFGLATVTLVTASAQTDATIPGLPAAEAARLRDRLSELGDPRGSGL